MVKKFKLINGEEPYFKDNEGFKYSLEEVEKQLNLGYLMLSDYKQQIDYLLYLNYYFLRYYGLDKSLIEETIMNIHKFFTDLIN